MLLVLYGCATSPKPTLNSEVENSSDDIESFMANIKWEPGRVSMPELYDYVFEVDSEKYQLWINDSMLNITLVPAEKDPNRWVSLNETDTEKLMTLLKEEKLIEYE